MGEANATGSSDCNKYVGFGNWITKTCAESTHADYVNGVCRCSDYMCAENGACGISVGELGRSVQNGVSGVQEQLNDIVNRHPAISNSISEGKGFASGGVEKASRVMGDWMWNSNCKSTVGSCILGSCPDSAKYTATCSYGICSCKQNFCYSKVGGRDMCVPDLNQILHFR